MEEDRERNRYLFVWLSTTNHTNENTVALRVVTKFLRSTRLGKARIRQLVAISVQFEPILGRRDRN